MYNEHLRELYRLVIVGTPVTVVVVNQIVLLMVDGYSQQKPDLWYDAIAFLAKQRFRGCLLIKY
jgi:hypothetical protein